jgi:hypothetical protein
MSKPYRVRYAGGGKHLYYPSGSVDSTILMVIEYLVFIALLLVLWLMFRHMVVTTIATFAFMPLADQASFGYLFDSVFLALGGFSTLAVIFKAGKG